MPGSDLYFLAVSAHVSLKVAIKSYFRDKKYPKILYFSKSKTEHCDQND